MHEVIIDLKEKNWEIARAVTNPDCVRELLCDRRPHIGPQGRHITAVGLLVVLTRTAVQEKRGTYLDAMSMV